MILGRDQQAIRSRLQEQMERAGLDALIFTSPDSIFYSTGFASNFLYASHNAGTTIAVIPAQGEAAIVCSEFEQQAVRSSCPYLRVAAYPTWIYIVDYAQEGMVKEVQPDPNRAFQMAAEFVPNRGRGAKVGIEPNRTPYPVWEFYCKTFGQENMRDCTQVLMEARAVKTPWEIQCLRLATHNSELAMGKTAHAIVPGMTEAEVFQLFRRYSEELTPETTGIFQAHTIGTDFAPAFLPRNRRINVGDIVRLDGGPIVDCYNSDLSRTFAVGGVVAPERERIYASLWKGYERACQIIGPGVPMSQVFHEIQRAIADTGVTGYVRGHHGHSLGCALFGEEYPFIAPGEDRPFLPGMVFCLELPWYGSKNHSYNIEDTFLITEDGVEWFSQANASLIWA